MTKRIVFLYLIALVLVAISGYVLGRVKGGRLAETAPVPTSQPKESTKEAKEATPLEKTESELKKLKVEILELDVSQSRLRLPTLDFKTEF